MKKQFEATTEQAQSEHTTALNTAQLRIAELANANAELRKQIVSEYSDGMSEKLKENIKSTAITEAEKEKDRAHSREAEVLSILLLDIEPQHRGKHGPASKCSCGRFTKDCPEWQAIDPLRNQLKVWEKKQLERMREGRPFGLPRRHPKVSERYQNSSSWDFKGLPARIARLDRDIPQRERLSR